MWCPIVLKEEDPSYATGRRYFARWIRGQTTWRLRFCSLTKDFILLWVVGQQEYDSLRAHVRKNILNFPLQTCGSAPS